MTLDPGLDSSMSHSLSIHECSCNGIIRTNWPVTHESIVVTVLYGQNWPVTHESIAVTVIYGQIDMSLLNL